jgi:hypothetical protein
MISCSGKAFSADHSGQDDARLGCKPFLAGFFNPFPKKPPIGVFPALPLRPAHRLSDIAMGISSSARCRGSA